MGIAVPRFGQRRRRPAYPRRGSKIAHIGVPHLEGVVERRVVVQIVGRDLPQRPPTEARTPR